MEGTVGDVYGAAPPTMDAAQLVEQRKAGSITQEQFFIALNGLRRANSGLDSTRPSPSSDVILTTATTATEAEREAAAVNPSVEIVGEEEEEEETQRGGPVSCSVPSTSSVAAVDGVLDGSIGRPKVTPLNDTRQTPQPPSGIALPGIQAATDASDASIGAVSPRLGGPHRENNHVQRIGRGGDLVRHNNTPHEFARSISPPKQQAVASPTGGRGREKPQSTENDEQAHVVAQRREESEWLVSPRGETQSRRLSRKIPGDKRSELRSASGRNGQDSVLRGGESATRGASSPLRSDGETERNRTVKPQQWRPTGGGGSSPQQQRWQQVSIVQPASVQSQTVPPPLSPSATQRTVRSAAAVVINGNRLGGDSADLKGPVSNIDPRRIRGTREQQSSPVSSVLGEEERRVLTPELGRRRGLPTTPRQQRDSSVGSTSDGALPSKFFDFNTVPDSSSQQQQAWPGARITSSNTGEDASFRSLPWADSRRSRCRRSREEEGAAPRAAASRRLSGSASAGCLGRSDRVVSAVRCDQYGYPMHERGGLGSSGGVGERRLLFSPKIKGMPEFYRSRPTRNRPPESSRVSFERAGGSDVSQSNSVYERTSRWLAQSGELR